MGFLMILFLNPSCKSHKKVLEQSFEVKAPEHLSTIAFGSCNKPGKGDDIWTSIASQNPDLWIWLGDNIYGDTENMDLFRKKYERQEAVPQYASFRRAVPIYGIWDDHDYGVNDGDKFYSKKKESRDLLFDFLDVPSDHPAWKREGAYQSYTFGSKNKKVKLLLLDGRYFRDPLEADQNSDQRYLPNEEGDILGEAQWTWLEKELSHSDAQIHIIACGIQFIPTEQLYEKWANFPKARQRFFDLLTKTKPKNPILLSGDRHIAECSQIIIPGFQHPIYEITASGMTHTWSNPAATEPNPYRLGDFIVSKNYGLMNIDWNQKPLVEVEIWSPDHRMIQRIALDGLK